jgi:uncharacterized damage-inducible protein DinB
MNGLVEMFRHKTWATVRLIEHCERLADEHLDATTPGSYGSIRETLRHIVDSEEGYLSILTRQRFASQAAALAFEHRSQVMSILGARSLELPGPNDLDAWGYAEDTGAWRKLPAT